MIRQIRRIGRIGLIFVALSVGAQDADKVLEASGVKGGLVVVLGANDPQFLADLQAAGPYVVQALETDAVKVAKARQALQDMGVYGPVSVVEWSGEALPYTENLVNLVLVPSGPEALGAGEWRVAGEEIERVLAPGGSWIISNQQSAIGNSSIQPRPAGLDEWNHHLHSPNNNAVSKDTVVGPPKGCQWVAGQAWSRYGGLRNSLSAMVTANGRVFTVMDEAPRVSFFFKPDHVLRARDAFNGTILWERPVEEWVDHNIYKKNFPTIMLRRLVAVGDEVFFTFGLNEPVTVLDAASGHTKRTYSQTAKAQEILVDDRAIYVTCSVQPVTSDSKFQGEPVKRRIVVCDRKEDHVIWETEDRVTPMTLTVEGDRLFYHDGQVVKALHRDTGEELWRSEVVTLPSKIPDWYGPTLVAMDNRVLFSAGPEDLGLLWETTGDNKLYAFDAVSGKTVWTADHPPSGYKSPEDVFVVNGQVWFSDNSVGKIWDNRDNAGHPTTWKTWCYDLLTGELVQEIEPDAEFLRQHHRCHRGKSTVRYMISSNRGADFLDYSTGHWDISNWTRSGCNVGYIPANGLLYMPQHACACFIEMLLRGFFALKAESAGTEAPVAARRLIKGDGNNVQPYSALRASKDKRATSSAQLPSEDWTTYRGDALRSGSSKTEIDKDIDQQWAAALKAPITAPAIAGGRVFVAEKDTHTIVALDEETGRELWRFTANGRIDSPPTVVETTSSAQRPTPNVQDQKQTTDNKQRTTTLCIFGSRDGWVYALNADDGRLVWKFQAAPNATQVMDHNQPESAWPLHGSVLVCSNTVYALAGRSIHLDGGLRMIVLDAATGDMKAEHVMGSTDPETGEKLNERHVIGLPDLLSTDGRNIYMGSQVFDMEGERRGIRNWSKLPLTDKNRDKLKREQLNVHHIAPGGLLDDSYFSRVLWTFGEIADGSGRIPSGRLLVNDDDAVYGYGRKAEYFKSHSGMRYRLFRAPLLPEVVKIETGNRRAKQGFACDWQTNATIYVRGMVKAANTLAVAGPINPLDEGPPKPVGGAQLAAAAEEAERAKQAWQDQQGGVLQLIQPADGTLVREIKLPSIPVWDGMAAADEKIFICTMSGSVLCFGK